MNTLSERLNYLLKARGMSQSELARKVGIKQQSVFKLCAGHTKRTRYLYEIAEALKANPEWLATGKGDKNGASTFTLNAKERVLVAPVLELSAVESYLEKCKAGKLMPVADDQRALTVICTGGPHTYAIRVLGDSMNNPNGTPSLPEGAYVIVDPDKAIKPFDLIVVRADDGGSVVVRQYLKEVSQVFLKPLNPRYPLIEVNARQLTTFGVVVKTVILP